MKKTLMTLALAACLAVPTISKADGLTGPSKDNALAAGIGAGVTLALDASLPKAVTGNLRTFLVFAGSTTATMAFEGWKSAAQGREFNNGNLVAGLGGWAAAYQFHF
jgi:hypothetical protein